MSLAIKKPMTIEDSGYQYFTPSEILQKRNAPFRQLHEISMKMPRDQHLNPGEGRRYRYYARYQYDPVRGRLARFNHDSFFQSAKFDVLYGDIHRDFAPLPKVADSNTFLTSLLVENYSRFPISSPEVFEISLHLIRIEVDEQEQTGRPAPEGIHQDGYHFGAIHLIERRGLEGAENMVYDLDKRPIDRFFLTDPLQSLLFDDRKIFHGVTPFHGDKGSRCMLILLYQPLSESPQRPAPSKEVFPAFE